MEFCASRLPLECLVICCLVLGPSALWAADFGDLVASVAGIGDREPLDVEAEALPAANVSDEAVAKRKVMVIRAGAAEEINLKPRNPKHVFPHVLCRLSLDPHDAAALGCVPRGMRFRGQGDMFGKSSLSRVFCQFGQYLTPSAQEALRKEVTTYPGFLGGGTENHVTMRRTAGYLLGERFPEAKFHYGLTGDQLSAECRAYMRAYGKAIFRTSMVEYLSPTYHAVNTAPWINVVEFAKNEEARIMARAILDWMMADLAVNYHHGIILAPVQRAKGLMNDSYQLSYARTQAQWSAWLYWGGGNTPQDEESFQQPQYLPKKPYGMCGKLHAVSSWTPHPVIRNIGAKRVHTPYTVWQSRGNWACIEPAQVNRYGKTAAKHSEAPNARYNMRSVYVARDYAVGASYRHENIMDPVVRHAIPFNVVWRSRKARNRLLVAHPYWYTARKREGSNEPLGTDDWSGTSPFCQMVHWENAALLLFDIPELDPYGGKAGRGSPKFLSERARECVQTVYVYVPEAMDERSDTSADAFLREGDVYIAIRPFRQGARWEKGAYEGYERLAVAGGLVGVAIEVGDRREFGSFDDFRKKVAASRLDLSRLEAEKRVTYRTTRGHVLGICHSAEGWLPDASVNGVRLDLGRWPTCESPYVTCRDLVLDVNDGRSGFTIDWRDDLPQYTYYDLVGGQKRTAPRGGLTRGG